MPKKLYEFTALLKCALVIAADTEADARETIQTYERHWYEGGDFIGVSDIELVDVREADQDSIKDFAHEIV